MDGMHIPLKLRRRKPPVPKQDSPCAQCGGDRRPERSRSYGKDAALSDPFCSRGCCEKWYGISEAAEIKSEEDSVVAA